MRKVLYLSLKEFRSAQKRQLDGDGTTNTNGESMSCAATSSATVKLDITNLAFGCVGGVDGCQTSGLLVSGPQSGLYLIAADSFIGVRASEKEASFL